MFKTRYRVVKSNKNDYFVIEKKSWSDIFYWGYVGIANTIEEAKERIVKEKSEEKKEIVYSE